MGVLLACGSGEPRVSRSRVKGGSGLGLSIVQAIVEGNDGNITAFNDPEGGAVFLIAFPSVIDR